MVTSEQPTQVLREEHHLIEKAALAFADTIRQLEAGAALDRRRVWELARSFKTYVERCHHAKEDFLLSMVRTRGTSSAEYPMRAFYEEHQRIQLLLGNLARAADEHRRMFHGTVDRIVRALRAVVDFYPGHMWKADHLLFPLADGLLSETDQRVLLDQFVWIESVVGGDAEEQLREIVDEFLREPRAA